MANMAHPSQEEMNALRAAYSRVGGQAWSHAHVVLSLLLRGFHAWFRRMRGPLVRGAWCVVRGPLVRGAWCSVPPGACAHVGFHWSVSRLRSIHDILCMFLCMFLPVTWRVALDLIPLCLMQPTPARLCVILIVDLHMCDVQGDPHAGSMLAMIATGIAT